MVLKVTRRACGSGDAEIVGGGGAIQVTLYRETTGKGEEEKI